MTKRERFLKYLANEPVDRVPVAFFHHFTTANEWFRGLESPEIFEKNIEGHRIAREKFDPDVIKVMNDSLMIMPIDTSFIEKASDLRKLTAPSVNSEFGKKSRELTLRVLDIYKDSDAPKYITGFAPMFVLRAAFLMAPDGGRAIIRKWIDEDRDAVCAALDNISQSIMELNKMLLTECGADGVYLSVNNQSHYIPDETYSELVTPFDMKVMADADKYSDINALHVCGYQGKANNLQIFKDYKAKAYNWAVHAEGMSLSEGKKLFNGAPVFGGFEQEGVIYKGTREELEAAVFAILDEAGQTGIMLGADCTVPTDIDDTRLEWVRQAAVKYAETH